MPVFQFPLDKLNGFSALIRAFTEKDTRIQPYLRGFYNGHASIENRDFSDKKREVLCEALLKQYKGQEHPLLQKLRQANAFTIATGHQLPLAGGPLFFISKIASVIAEAEVLNREQSERVYIPLFWMASEDHDFQEISSVRLFGQDFSWSDDSHGPVGRINSKNWLETIAQICQLLQSKGAEPKWIHLLESAYQMENWSEATRALIDGIFGKDAILILDADDRTLKQQFVPIMLKECSEHTALKAMNRTIDQFSAHDWPVQLRPREINLFYFSDKGRKRIVDDGEKWLVHDHDHSWENFQKLKEEIESFPERFSPNAALRPVYQECILPNVLYVGGPGEIAYWLELKGVFTAFEVPYPLLALRDHFLWINEATWKKMASTEVSIEDLFGSKNDIVNHWVKNSTSIDFEAFKSKVNSAFDEIGKVAGEVDSTLIASVNAERQKAIAGMEGIEKKIYKALRQKEDVRIKKLDAIFSFVYPQDMFQDRVMNFFEMITYFPEMLIEMRKNSSLRKSLLNVFISSAVYPENAGE